jgi:retinol-binding protein 3
MRFEGPVSNSNRSFFKGATAGLLLTFMLVSGSSVPIHTSAQTASAIADRDLDATTRRLVIEELILQLRRRYVLPEAVGKLEARLRAKLGAGAYDSATSAMSFARSLTDELRTAGDDLHFDVSYNPARERALKEAGANWKSKLPDVPLTVRERESLRRSNYGFRKTEILLGNIGYLALDSFVDLKYSRETAVAAMAFIANADAVIIDLRGNHGGSGNLVDFLTSYFFGPEPVELMSSYDRETNITSRGKTLGALPGKRLPAADLYILTDRETGSAAEALAFTLQQVGRGKTVGDRTVGAAHGGGWVPVGQGFVAFIPTFRGFNPRTGKSWNNTGVQPDVAVLTNKPLEAAHLEAVKGLLAKASADSRRQELDWIMPLLELRAGGERPVPQSRLSDYVGSYEGVTVSLIEGQLYFLGASGIRRRLLAIAEDLFLVEDSTVPAENQARARFARNAGGSVSELQLIVNDGRVFRRPRK